MQAEENYLLSMAKHFAGRDERYTATLFSFYSVEEKLIAVLEKVLPSIRTGKKSWHPFGVAVGHMKNHAVLKSESFIIGAPPTLNMFVDQRKLEMPDTNYLVACSPCIKHDQFEDPYPAKQTIGIMLGLISAVLGRVAFLDHIIDQILHPSESQESAFTRVFRVPHPDDFIHFTDDGLLSEVTTAIDNLSDDERGKFLFVLNIFGRAVHERDEALRFSLYWIALEVITGTKGNGIAAKLGNVYSRHREYAFEELQFRAAYNYRNALFHKGVIQSFSGRLERLMQCYFYDFLRARLNLPCKSLALNAILAFQK